MIFTHLARLLAIAALLLGLFHVVLGLAIATEFIGPYHAALARYTTKSSSGEVIDMGARMVLVAIALGTLAEISFSMRRAGST
jgi:hypothetical protein